MKAKTSSPDKFTEKQQTRLDEVAELIIDLEEQIELAEDESSKANVPENDAKPENGYKPEPGSEQLVHLKIIRGKRFDENTGKEISNPYIQKFTYGEYLNFKKNAERIGYTVVEELYNPYKNRE